MGSTPSVGTIQRNFPCTRIETHSPTEDERTRTCDNFPTFWRSVMERNGSRFTRQALVLLAQKAGIGNATVSRLVTIVRDFATARAGLPSRNARRNFSILQNRSIRPTFLAKM